MSTPHRFPLLAAGLFGASGVGLGAFGAHALRAALTDMGTRDRWETAVFYQLIHTVALFGAAVWLRTNPASKAVLWAVRYWTIGIVLFSGGLYVMALNPNAPLVVRAAVPPLGGTAFIFGWLFIAAAALAKPAAVDERK